MKRVFDAIRNGMFGRNEYDCIIDSVEGRDFYLCGQDFEPFVEVQKVVDRDYMDRERWVKKTIASTANMQFFSSDRTIQEYAEQIWNIQPCPIPTIEVEEDISGNGSVVIAPQQKVGSIKQQTVGSLRRHHMGSLPPEDLASIPTAHKFSKPPPTIAQDNSDEGEIAIDL